MAIIRVHALTKTFQVVEKAEGLGASMRSLFAPKKKDIPAVRGVSFEVERGEVLAFIGPNGAGKSTTIKMLTGILHPTSGQAEVLGLVPWQDRRKLAYSIGSVFGQRSQLWYHLPPSDTLTLLGRIYEVPGPVFKQRLGKLVDLFELKDIMNTPVRKLSLGQRMRCEIAASLLHSPKVLFLDEPTIGLDVVARQKIRSLIKSLNRDEGVTVFLTSHDVGDIEELCKRVMIINHGEIILDTTVSSMRRDLLRFKTVRVRLREPVTGFAMDGVTVQKHKGANLKLSVDTDKVDLDQVIAALMRSSGIADITISDPPTEQVIAYIYEKEGRGQPISGDGEEADHDS